MVARLPYPVQTPKRNKYMQNNGKHPNRPHTDYDLYTTVEMWKSFVQDASKVMKINTTIVLPHWI